MWGRTDLLDESDEMVQHRTERRKRNFKKI